MDNNQSLLPADRKRKRLIRIQSKTNPNYGKKPEERSVRELLNNGMITVDKPSGPTSHQVVSWVKEMLEVDKAGHGGTLDPNATGILPVALGNATKALQVLLSAGKEYVGVMRLHKNIEYDEVVRACEQMVGDIHQIPPVRSAVKRVRRKRRIYYLDLLEVKERDVLFRVGCEAGTYVRTLCVDIGKKIGSGAHLAKLRRTRIGSLRDEDAVILQDVLDAYVFWKEEGNNAVIRSIIFPTERLLNHLPKVVIRDSAVDALCHGADLAIPGVVEIDTEIKKRETIAVLSLKGEGVALGNALMSTEEIIQKDVGICVETNRVLMQKGTYPRYWKKT